VSEFSSHRSDESQMATLHPRGRGVEADLIRLRTMEGMRIAKAMGRLRGKQPKLNSRPEAHLIAL
jgi:hypothetical protein